MEEQEIQQRIEARKGEREYSNIIVALWRWGFLNDNEEAVACETLEDVVKFIGKNFRNDKIEEPNVKIHVQGKVDDLFDKYVYFKSETYKTDDRNGVCADGDPLSIRYARIDNGRIFKMRCGKFFRRLVDEMRSDFPENCRVYFSEQLAAMYRGGHAEDGRYELTLNRDFETIYSESGEFGSCMHGHNNWLFYVDSVPDALAAGLWENGKLVARCIVYKATDQDGKVWRLAERRYGKNAETRRHLVHLLIEQNKIDGYKQYEAGCWDNRNFVGVDGTDLSCSHLEIECTATGGDYCSFQDSFRYLNCYEGKARNWEENYDYDLAKTDLYIGHDDEADPEDGDLDGDQRYVSYDGEWYDADETHYDNHREEWRHEDDLRYCEIDDEYCNRADVRELYDGTYAYEDNCVYLNAGEHSGCYAHQDDDIVTCYNGRRALTEDCHELTHGEQEGQWAACDVCVELDSDIYGDCAYCLDIEYVETYNGEIILENDCVWLNGGMEAWHKNDICRAMLVGKGFIDAIKEDCVLICGTWYVRERDNYDYETAA